MFCNITIIIAQVIKYIIIFFTSLMMGCAHTDQIIKCWESIDLMRKNIMHQFSLVLFILTTEFIIEIKDRCYPI